MSRTYYLEPCGFADGRDPAVCVQAYLGDPLARKLITPHPVFTFDSAGKQTGFNPGYSFTEPRPSAEERNAIYKHFNPRA